MVTGMAHRWVLQTVASWEKCLECHLERYLDQKTETTMAVRLADWSDPCLGRCLAISLVGHLVRMKGASLGELMWMVNRNLLEACLAVRLERKEPWRVGHSATVKVRRWVEDWVLHLVHRWAREKGSPRVQH